MVTKSFTKQSLAQQLAGKLEQLIHTGQWPGGTRLPAIRKIAADYDVSINTAHLALRELEAAGRIQRRQHGAAFVLPGLIESVSIARNSRGQPAHIAIIGTVGPGPRPSSARDAWAIRILMAAEAELFKSSGFHLTRVGSMQADQQRYVQELISQLRRLAPNLAGAIVFGANNAEHYEALRSELNRLELPWVSINRPTERATHNFVSADNLAAGQVVGRCFTLLGFERVLLLSPDLRQALSWRQKMMGVVDAYLLAGRPVGGFEHLQCAGMTEPQGDEAMRAHLRQAAPPEAIFAIGDLLAMGAMRACREAGLDVPGQVSVVGSTGLEVAQFTTPSLAVVTQPMAAMGRMAARRLLTMIRAGERRIPGCRIAGRLIVRDSLSLPEAVRQTLLAEGVLRAEPAVRRPPAVLME